MGRTLAHANVRRENVAEALKVYEAVRLPAAQEVLERSRTVGLFYDFNHPDFDADGVEITHESLKTRADELQRYWSRQWEGTPEGAWELIAAELEKL